MKCKLFLFPLLAIVFIACSTTVQNNIKHQLKSIVSGDAEPENLIDTSENTLGLRIKTESGFERTDSSDYANYFRNLKLKPHNSQVKMFDGSIKTNHNVYCAVLDQKIGQRDLHQCADAVMRLRADYLWQRKEYDKIHFNFTNGFRVDYDKWRQGYRVSFKGNKTSWHKKTSASNSYDSYWKYMELIFSYAGSLSLSRELKSVPKEEMKIGDVWILGGTPGHAVMVVDMCENKKTGKKKFLLTQSYMPAQETQILMNPKNDESPWYDLDFEGNLVTPEWTFTPNQLMRFKD